MSSTSLTTSPENTAESKGLTNMFKTFFKSFVPPVRDEEHEIQRKAHAKRVRETRRSTQGVTLEDLKSAEQLVKKKQQQENAQRTTELQQLASSSPTSIGSTTPSGPPRSSSLASCMSILLMSRIFFKLSFFFSSSVFSLPVSSSSTSSSPVTILARALSALSFCTFIRNAKALGSIKTTLLVLVLSSVYLTAILWAPALSPILLLSMCLTTLVVLNHIHPFLPCALYSSPFCLTTVKLFTGSVYFPQVIHGFNLSSSSSLSFFSFLSSFFFSSLAWA